MQGVIRRPIIEWWSVDSEDWKTRNPGFDFAGRSKQQYTMVQLFYSKDIYPETIRAVPQAYRLSARARVPHYETVGDLLDIQRLSRPLLWQKRIIGQSSK